MKWAKLGHHVKLVSATNGDVGHWQMAGGPLALRRKKEVLAVGQRLGVTTEVLDIHDGEIMPTLENRRTFTRLIREWNADVVITNRPNDYHPDHRHSDSGAGLSLHGRGSVLRPGRSVTAKRNPVFLYTSDRFQRPNPFRADVAVGIDEVMEPTLDALLLMESQIQEGGADGNASLYPQDEAVRQRRRDQVRRDLERRYQMQADNNRDALVKFYGQARGQAIRHAQAFEICEYRAAAHAGRAEAVVPLLNRRLVSPPASASRNLRDMKRRTMRRLPENRLAIGTRALGTEEIDAQREGWPRIDRGIGDAHETVPDSQPRSIRAEDQPEFRPSRLRDAESRDRYRDRSIPPCGEISNSL